MTRTGWALAALSLLSMGLNGCAEFTPSTSAARQESASAPSATPASPEVHFAADITDSAAAFAGFLQRASAIRPDYTNSEALKQALGLGAVFDPDQLEEGAVALAALSTSRDAAFVHAVGESAISPEARDFLADRLRQDPSSVLQIPEAATAARRAAATLGTGGRQLYQAGLAVKQSAYDVQHQAWSRLPIPHPEVELTAIKSASAMPEPLSPQDSQALAAALADGDVATESSTPITPVVVRGLALAALAVLGQAGEDQLSTLQPLLSEASSKQCLKMARLDLNMCLSVVGPNYEDAFCLGRHAMIETAQCVITSAGWATPASPPQPPAQTVARSDSFVPSMHPPSKATVRR